VVRRILFSFPQVCYVVCVMVARFLATATWGDHHMSSPHVSKTRLPALLLSFAACAIILCTPVQGLALFGSVSEKDEIEMGKKFDESIRKQLTFVDDPEIIAYVKSVVDRVALTLPPMSYPIRSSVVANGSMNAFAVPGGYIYIFTGLILGVENESELAAVIGHELAHVTQRHVAKRLDQMKFVSMASVAGMVAGALLGMGGGSNSGALGRAVATGSMAGAQSAFLMYTRENEREADHVGMGYLIKAGYNPLAMPETFELMNKRRWFMSGDSLPSYLSTHPGLDERSYYLRDRIKTLPAEYTKRAFETARFLRIQTLLRARMVSPETALAYYDNKPKKDYICLDNVGRAIVLERLKRTPEAEKSFADALLCGQNDAVVLREAGTFYFNRGQFDKAGPYLQKAVIMNPKDAMTEFFLARLMAEKKDYTNAIPTMQRVMREVPEDSEVRYYLGRMLGESGNVFGAHVQLAYAAHYGRDQKKAEFHLTRVKSMASSPDQKKELADLEKLISPRPAGGQPPAGQRKP